MPRESYAKWDFDNFNAEGLSPLVKALERQRVGVAEVEGSNKPSRASGKQTKKAILILRDGQNVMLQVTNDGAIYQVRLNNRVIPIRASEDINAIAKEIAVLVKKGRAAFQAKLAKQAEKGAQNFATTSAQSLTIRSRIDGLRSGNEPMRERLASLRNRINEIRQERESVEAEIKQYTEQLVEIDGQREVMADQVKNLRAQEAS